MTPALTRSGLLVVGVGTACVFGGALVTAWPLVALGFSQLAAVLVLYVLFIPQCALLRRRQLEFAWWVPAAESAGGALLVDRPLTLHLLLRNHSPFRLAVSQLRIMASSAIELEGGDLATVLAPRRESRLRARAVPRSAGYWFFHGMSLSISDRSGAFAVQLYYPNLLCIKVFPPLAIARDTIPFRPRTGALHERAGQRVVRQRGLGTDLREIRDHVPGDPFKRIAWKATARSRRLMVREFESEIVTTHWLLLDISASMRSRRPGHGKLDYGLGLCAAYARLALEAGDRVGLITFDHRIYSQVNAGDGRPHLFAIIDRLMELHSIVDEDLTDLTDQELYGAVADYLAHQEGLAVQVPGRPPRRDDPVWAHLVEGPRGEVYDATAMVQAVTSLLKARRPSGASWWWNHVVAGHPWTAQLRLFCRLSGLEIPYRQSSTLMGKEGGMAEALGRASAPRHSQLIVLVSDLEELAEPRPVLDALRLAKRRHHGLVVVAPFAPGFLAAPEDEHGERVQQIFALRAERQRREAKRGVERLGVPVISAAPSDALQLLLRRLAQYRTARAGAAS
jgi:uncharacterized protein (DUF58 family)